MTSKCHYQEVYPKEIQQQFDREFDRVKDVCYLDHTGSTLYASSQIQAVARDLCGNVYGNPHSLGTVSRYATDAVDQVRYQVLKHFETDSDEYSVVFTSGATGALKLVAEAFDWTGENAETQGECGTFAYLQDNHTSVLGMREVAARSGARVRCVSRDQLSSRTKTVETSDGNSLFVYPAQCNFSGVKYPLAWIEAVRAGILGEASDWFCLLDAASFVGTNRLDLSAVKPDFVCVSFYKMFGYPTGLGALLVRNASAHVLRKVYFGGGTVLISLSAERFHVPRPVLHDMLEDGTVPFLSIISLRHGFETMSRLTPDLPSVALHTFSLARYVHHSLLALRHSNGAPAVILYADTDYEDADTQGNIVNLNVLRPDGEHVGYMEVLNMANLYNIHLRTGCFCNPGACQRHLQLSTDELQRHFQAGHVCGDTKDLIDGRPTGSVRISFGYMSSRRDADTFLEMIATCFVRDRVGSSVETCDRKFRPEDDVATLSHIFVYPVKSCAAFSTRSWTIGPRGLRFDREWMVVTPAGVSLTQKQDARMCMITPTIDIAGGVLQLDFPGLAPLLVPLNEDSNEDAADSTASLCQSKVCGDRVQGRDCGDEAAAWLSEALARDGLRLVRQWGGDQRSARNTTKERKTNLSLSNQAQFLLLNSASVGWLGDRLSEDANCSADDLVQRFRCNLVVRGPETFAENEWKAVDIGRNRFLVEGQCTRCQMVCIDQSTGEKTREPLKTLAKMFHGKMRFGVYLSHAGEGGETEITTGSEVYPRLERD